MGKRWASSATCCRIWLVTGFLAGKVIREHSAGALVAFVAIFLGGAVLLWRQWQ